MTVTVRQFTADEFATAFVQFMAIVEDVNFDHVALNVQQAIKRGDNPQHARNACADAYSFMPGTRYIRVVTDTLDGIHSSVFCFVDSKTGDVLKADGWKKPAKHARGNIFNEDTGRGAISAYGANYMR